MRRPWMEIRDDQGGDPLGCGELRVANSLGAAKLRRLPGHGALGERANAFGGQVDVMPASGRVPAVESTVGSQIPPVPVPSNAEASSASERPPLEALKGLGRLLVARRELRGMTRQELADCLNYSDSAVASIEHGLKPGPRTFWALADRALDAGGSLLADADRSLLIWAAAMREQLRGHHHAARRAAGPGRAMPSRAPVVDRVFANDLGAISVQGRRPSGCCRLLSNAAHGWSVSWRRSPMLSAFSCTGPTSPIPRSSPTCGRPCCVRNRARPRC